MCESENSLVSNKMPQSQSPVAVALAMAGVNSAMTAPTSSSSHDSQLQAQQILHQNLQSLQSQSMLMTIMTTGSESVSVGSTVNDSILEATYNAAVMPLGLNLEELMRENYALREKLKEVSTDRDRLLCEVSNLRLELDMSELKRLPEDISFPQKVIDRTGPTTQYALPASGAIAASSAGVGGYVYLQQQQHYAPPPQQIIYQHHHHQMCQQPTVTATTGGVGVVGGIAGSVVSQSSTSSSPAGHNHHHIHHGQQHHHHHGGAVVVAGSGVGTGVGGSMQSLHKKNSIRSGGEVLKRTRGQTAYELSQDLLEKQIELLERKYGGVCARNAAVTIQRAFRHYMMVKKFASITAMAKAEKRLSRRMMTSVPAGTGDDGPPSNTSSSAYGSASESQLEQTGAGTQMHQQQQQQQQQQLQQSPQQQLQSQQPRVTIMAGPPRAGNNHADSPTSRIPPTRSMSLRERRQLDSSPIPRSQSGNTSPMPPATTSTCWSQSSGISGASNTTSHPHVNLMHAEQHYYNANQQLQLAQYHYAQQQGQTYHQIPHDASFCSNNSQLDSSINSSLWVSNSSQSHSPHTPYYTAAQIYMRPRCIPTPNSGGKKVPPEVPKRTSSITAQQQAALLQQQQQHQLQQRQTPPPPPPSSMMMRSNGLCKTSENGSLTSVQSSGSDSSVTSVERIANCDLSSDRSNSPHTWKRGTNLNSSNQFSHSPDHLVMLASHAATATAVGGQLVSDECMSSHTSAAQYEQHDQNEQLNATTTTQNYKVSETLRKRQYRVGLNLFNKKPEKGIAYLIRRGFLENTPQGVAKFLNSRKGLSRQMIGEYLGNLQNQFNMAVLECFAGELDLSGMQVDVALRKFQAYFRMPGEAQKIERLMEIFSQRYCQCNSDIVGRLRSSDTIFVLAFAIIMLNTDLHTPNLKPDRRMRVEDFIKNLRGIDDCHDIDREMLAGVYERVKANEFKPGSDHVTQVMKVQATIVGKKPNLALPHRRLVCYCRLYEIPDVNKKERPGVHQREVFLFNDLLVITKIFSKKKSSVTYTFRNSYPLCGMVVTLLDVPNYPYCIQLSQKVDGKNLITFNARNEHDRCKFAEDLKESISEMDEMETLRIEAELERQKSARNRTPGNSENRDSGVADVEVCPCPYQSPQGGDVAITGHESAQLKRSALSNSLLDMHEQFGNEKPQRRGSVGSLDSGMSISFQSTTASSASRENAAIVAAAANAAAAKMRFPPPAANQQYQIQNHQIIQNVGVGAVAVAGSAAGTVAYQIHPLHMPPAQQASAQPAMGRIPRERKHSRSDESGRSTEV